MIEHDFHGVASRGNELDYPLEKPPCPFAVDRRQTDEARVQFDRSNELSEIPGISCYDYPVFSNTPLTHLVITFAAPAKIERMNCIVHT